MCFLLALVVLLMQRAAEPRYYESAFRALGVPFDDAGSLDPNRKSYSTVVNEGNANGPALSKEASIWPATCRDLVSRTFADFGQSQVNEFAAMWFQLEGHFDPTAVDRVVAQSQERAEAVASEALKKLTTSTGGVVKPELENWRVALKLFPVAWDEVMRTRLRGVSKVQTEVATSAGETLPTEVSDPVSTPQQQQLLAIANAYLDSQLGNEVFQDASPWRTSEQVAFDRWLQKADYTTLDQSNQAFRISTQQLEAESQSLKGRCVRFRGAVHQVDHIQRNSRTADEGGNSTKSDGYWVVWMRGLDLGLQPVAIYTQNSIADSFVGLGSNDDR
ncbi:MAG: hypothetical protein AAGG44_21435, partial [Planctomycetota bacterium]